MDAGATRALGQFCFDNDAVGALPRRCGDAPASPFPSFPASCPPRISKAWRAWRPSAAPPFPPGWPRPMTGSTTIVETRRIVAAAVLAEQVQELRARGFDQFHFYTLNQANLTYAACRILGIAAQRNCHEFRPCNARIRWMKEEAQKRILLLDGSWGVMIQGYKLERRGFPRRALRQSRQRAERQQRSSDADQARRSSARSAAQYLEAGADFIETNTFNSDRQAPGRLRPGASGGRTERGGRQAGARDLRRAHRPPTARAWSPACWGRPTAPPPSRRTSTIRPSATSPSTNCAAPTRGDARPDQGRLRRADDRDDLRHAELPRPRSSPSRKRSTNWACACRSGFPAPSPICRAAR